MSFRNDHSVLMMREPVENNEDTLNIKGVVCARSSGCEPGNNSTLLDATF